MTITDINHVSFSAYDYSERFDLLGQVDGESLIPNEIAWDIAAATIANIASRTGVPLPAPIADQTSVDNSGASALYSSSFVTVWIIIAFFG